MPKKITYADMVRARACERGLAIFRDTFGDSVDVTEENALKLVAANGYSYGVFLVEIFLPQDKATLWKRKIDSIEDTGGFVCSGCVEELDLFVRLFNEEGGDECSKVEGTNERGKRDRKSTRLNYSHTYISRMLSSA